MTMASELKVKKYLAYWFQLGKKVVLPKYKEKLAPQQIFREDSYSKEFEECWQIIVTPENRDCDLEGTHQTIQELLTSKWQILPCARCDMPIPMIDLGIAHLNCPCVDLDNWPNTEVPLPRNGVNSQHSLSRIRGRLLRNEKVEQNDA